MAAVSPQLRGRCGLAPNLVTAAAISEPPSEHRLGFHHHHHQPPATRHRHSTWIKIQYQQGHPEIWLSCGLGILLYNDLGSPYLYVIFSVLVESCHTEASGQALISGGRGGGSHLLQLGLTMFIDNIYRTAI